MVATDFFKRLTGHFDEVLPFVAYRKPNEQQLNAFLQKDDSLVTTTDFSESGFVFAPFDQHTAQSILIADTYVLESTQRDTQEIHSNPLTVHSSDNQKAFHIDLVQKGIAHIANSDVKKVVLSRKQTVKAPNAHPVAIFQKMLQAYRSAFVYCWYHPKVGLWLGATPETLLSIQNRKLHTMSLAGTQPYKGTLEAMWGTKELEEQQFVTDAIVANINPLVSNLKISDTCTHRAGNMIHLKTDISADYRTDAASLATIINALHPTPAVCGLPKLPSKDFILENEGYHRSYYTGFLGELNIKKEMKRARNSRNVENLAYGAIKKESHLFVNLRCMEIDAAGAQIYVGGGITAGSNPTAEWEETVQKLSTMLRVL